MLDSWFYFAGIFILSCIIAVLQNQPVCSLRSSGFFLAQVSSFTCRGQTKVYLQRGPVWQKGVTIPRLELVTAPMASNLVAKVKDALLDQPIRTVYGWLDSTVALHWI